MPASELEVAPVGVRTQLSGFGWWRASFYCRGQRFAPRLKQTRFSYSATTVTEQREEIARLKKLKSPA
jgi:hypothetical protein